MAIIYEPRGRAREYSPLALNLYDGCDHGCRYCYVPAMRRMTREKFHANPKPRVVSRDQLVREAGSLRWTNRQVLMSFTSDPYCIAELSYGRTRDALNILLANKVPVAILTKAGATTVLRDMDVITRFGRSLKLGTTLTFTDDRDSRSWEPYAATPDDRLAMLREAYEIGVPTWVSIEPVIDPGQSLDLISASLGFVGEYRIGKVNHMPEVEASIDWRSFLESALALVRGRGKVVYVKEDIRAAVMAAGEPVELSADEMDRDVTIVRPFERE